MISVNNIYLCESFMVIRFIDIEPIVLHYLSNEFFSRVFYRCNGTASDESARIDVSQTDRDTFSTLNVEA